MFSLLYGVYIILLILISRNSDQTLERKWLLLLNCSDERASTKPQDTTEENKARVCSRHLIDPQTSLPITPQLIL